MNVLVVHNKYKQKGGEDVVVANEVKLLKEMGYTVFEYIRSNDELDSMGLLQKICLPFTTIFSIKSYKEVYKLIIEKNIDILHVHNTLCVISPSVYYAGFKAKIPVFQTIHNYRIMCPGGLFLKDNTICTDCIDKGLHMALKGKCYRNSYIQTLTVVLMLKIHRIVGTYNRLNYICISEFNKEQLMRLNRIHGIRINEEQVYVKPHFLDK